MLDKNNILLALAATIVFGACVAQPDSDHGRRGSDEGTPDPGNGSGSDSGSGSGSDAQPDAPQTPPYNGPVFTAAVDSDVDRAWTIQQATFYNTQETYPSTQTWIRATMADRMIDLSFGPGVPTTGATYSCTKLTLPLSPPSSTLYWLDNGATSFSSECSPSVQSQPCTIHIDQASGSEGRIRGTFDTAVGCPGIVHRIKGSFDVMLPYTAP